MRIVAFILLVFCLHVTAKSVSQTITLSGKDIPLAKVFEEIEKQCGYLVVVGDNRVDGTKAITVNVKDYPLFEFMAETFGKEGLTYVVENKTVFLKKDEQQHVEKEKTSTEISGRVTDKNGQSLPGINVMIKGTKRGTVTDSEGKFKINAEEGDVLLISAVGFEKKEIKVNGSQPVTIALEIATSVLDEVQYIAYGQETKRFSVSNTASIKAVDIEKQPVQNLLLAVQGRVPGLLITQPSGLSGAPLNVRIQGQNSLANGNDPLYVVDGVPIDPQLPKTGVDDILYNRFAGNIPTYGNPLNYINPSDIESIEILKDADATAIYGSRAANGAILITTKKGKAGPMKLDVDIQAGIGRVARRLEMMNTRQYLDMRYEAFRNDNIDWRSPSVSANDLKVWDTTHYTDWQKELLSGNARYYNANLSLSGGTNIVRYLVSGTYHRQTTVFPFPDFADQKGAVHFNLNANNSDQKFRMQFSGNFMFDDNELPQSDVTSAAMLMEPNAPPLLNADGSINWAPDANGNTTLGAADVNVMIQRLQRYVNKTYNLVSSLKLDYTILPGLNIGTSIGYNYMQTNDYMPEPLSAVQPELRARKQRGARFGNRNIQSWIAEPQANYQTKIGKGSFEVMVGSTFQSKTAVSSSLHGTGQLSDELLDDINAAATITRQDGFYSNYRYNALFARTKFLWNDRYIVNLNARRDGSSRFGTDNLFHNFGSIGAAWIFSSENFFKGYDNVISFGKLRGSYGTTGSDQIDDYLFMSLYKMSTFAAVPYQGVVGISPVGLPNPALQWEATRKLQIGLDLGFLQDRMMLTTTYARNRSSNQLLQYSLPWQAGFTSYLVNFPATVQNRNWEFTLNAKVIQAKQLTWSSNINLTLPQNKLVAFPNIAQSTYANFLHVGSPIDVYTFYHWIGVAPGTGDYLYADKKGNPTIAPNASEDRTVAISKFPKFYGGFQNAITYKGLQLDFLFQFVQQTTYNDATFFNGNLFRFPGMFQPGVSNQPAALTNRWQQPGDNDKTVARYRTTDLPYILDSDRRYAETWYVRLKNIALSWDLPENWLKQAHIRTLRLYVHAQNLLTITNYKGLDPETQSLSSLPPLQLWTGGIQLGL